LTTDQERRYAYGMKVLIIYRPNSEHGRITEDYMRDFQRRYPEQQIDALNVDSREGSMLASLYDITQYPAIMVTQNDGQMQRCWMGEPLPLMDEILSYSRG